MKFIYRWLAQKIRSTEYEKVGLSSDHISMANFRKPCTMNVVIHRATSGFVIECRKHPSEKVTGEELHSSLHIVTDDQDLGQELNRIVTFEMLR
jgi:hypothetical protein